VGLSALEAMAEGTPVVAYDVGGPGEYGGGLVVEASPQALIDGFRRLTSDTEEWGRLSEGGVAAVRGWHSLERYLTEIEAVYRDAADGAPG
jgi:glycosyltransferase involved in cell wall biosynthesis